MVSDHADHGGHNPEIEVVRPARKPSYPEQEVGIKIQLHCVNNTAYVIRARNPNVLLGEQQA